MLTCQTVSCFDMSRAMARSPRCLPTSGTCGFEGRGPGIAERSRTNDCMPNRYTNGTLLLCNEHGVPLHWCTLPGRSQDREALRALVGATEDREWVQNVLIVFDRAMGSAGAVAKLWSGKLRFLSHVPRPKSHCHCRGLWLSVPPSSTLADLYGREDQTERIALIASAGSQVSATGMH